MLSNLVFKIERKKVDDIVSALIDANKTFFNTNEQLFLVTAKIQAAALLSTGGEFDEFCASNKVLRFDTAIPIRVWPSEDSYYYVKYNRSFIHIPKTSGRHMIYKYFVYQTGGNHMFANEDSKHYNHYCKDFKRCFTVVRNPFSWLYSYWNHRSDENVHTGVYNCNIVYDNSTFEKFIFNVCNLSEQDWFPFDNGMTTQLFDKEGKICASDIMFFERHSEGIEALQLEEKYEPFLSGEIRKESHKRFLDFKPSRTDYRVHYTTEMIDLVSEKFKFDLDFLGYDFEGLTHDKDSIHLDAQASRTELINSENSNESE